VIQNHVRSTGCLAADVRLDQLLPWIEGASAMGDESGMGVLAQGVGAALAARM
jgi:hypothetical protein